MQTGVRLAICDSLLLATVVLLNDLRASFLDSQKRKPDRGFRLRPHNPSGDRIGSNKRRARSYQQERR
jgi:hypothetical protein